ncbi:MAG: hypothetical protein ABJ084_03830 [Halioglobus sp.]
MKEDVEQILAAADVVNTILANAGDAMTGFITVIGGYLLVAYLAGKDLTKAQTILISALFIVFSGFNISAVVMYFQSAFHFGHLYGAGRVPAWPSYGLGILFSIGVFACLKFMWDVRHPKAE